jgi:hypothetical protein
MRQYLFLALGTSGMILQVMVIYVMTRIPFRRFGGIFFYLLVLFLTSLADMAAFFEVGSWPEWYRKYYYINNVIRHFAGFVAVISLIGAATAEHPRRQALRLKLIAGTLAVVAFSFLVSRDPRLGMYMTKVARNLSFATVVLNLILWFSLIKVRERDRRLFLVSGGLGVNMAGEAIGQSMIHLSPRLLFPASLLNVGSHLFCLYIWWKAFRLAEPAPATPA